ncbi:MAG: GntR family transcriptional regulator [Planctomycetota bacterium]|jgi:DNA-binding LacI/PurR family transcriptional regulator
MVSKTNTVPRANGGRAAAKLATYLRAEITAGRIPAGQFLRTERQLAAEHGIARMTVRRALKTLEAEGLVSAEPRHGYRVLARATDPDRGFPVAYVLGAPAGAKTWDGLHGGILNSFQRAADVRGWSVLAVNSGERAQAEVMEQLGAARVAGVALDTIDRELIEMVRRAGMPAVMVDAWLEDAPFDLILQDNYRGAYLAAQHLVERGHKRIAWLGAVGSSGHSRERFAGAVAALVASGLELPPEMRCPAGDADSRQRARELLRRTDRPTGVLALWRGISMELAAEAAAQGLVLGKDLDIVGWSPEEDYEDYRRRTGEHGPVPAAVLWSIDHMARMGISRLSERRRDLYLPPIRLSVPTRLRKG